MKYYETREERSSVKTLLEEPFSLGEYLVSSLKIGESNRMMVDNLGKNMMLDTWDGQIWYPRFYDMDTICSYNNSGEIKFDVDIEMEQGYWNTSSSRLWTKVRDLMHDELVETYKDMRQNGMTFDSFMECFYGDQISKIPQKYYNKDYDVKYAPYSDQYIGKAHGDGYQHLKRWLKNRLIFTDTLFDYAPSYENDVLTIRANTLDKIDITIETYTPVYQHLSWYNGQMSKEKIVPGQSFTFSGNVQASTDQEILIYGGSNIKKITGISSANPNELIIGNAPRLTELVATNCPLLTTINSNKANLSAHTYLNKLDLSGCSQLGGILQLHNSQLIQDINMKGTAITGLQMPKSLRNLKVLRLPNTITELVLNDAPLLHTIELDEGNALQSISLLNCNKLDNCINFDLTKVPTISLDNSYNAEELYMSATTNLTLKNMPSLKRVIFTPNSEYSAFDINNVLNGASYKITTFNNPMMTDFITTAPHRYSYAKDKKEEILVPIVTTTLVENYNANYNAFSYSVNEFDFNAQYIEVKVDLTNCTDSKENIISFGQSLDEFEGNTIHIYYTSSSNEMIIHYKGNSYKEMYYPGSKNIILILNKDGLHIEDNVVLNSTDIGTMFSITSMEIGSQEGVARSDATYEYIRYVTDKTKVGVKVDITPNTAFTANTLDLSATQFEDIKLLCTTDVYNLKVPTTLKNFYCDSAMDIDTDVIEDGSYEVIHEELIEPYTTNYTKNIVLKTGNLIELKLSKSNTTRYVIINDTGNKQTGTDSTLETVNDYISVIPASNITIQGYRSDNNATVNYLPVIAEYNANKEFIKKTSINNVTLTENTYYVLIQTQRIYNNGYYYILSYNEAYTPNIIPSSANGSLIFNMYSNNTTQPTSTSPYMWDLTGLKLNDFYTYGMNNWVKPSDDSYVTYYKNILPVSLNTILGGSNGDTLGIGRTDGFHLLPPFDVQEGTIVTCKRKDGKATSYRLAFTDENNKILHIHHGNYNETSKKTAPATTTKCFIALTGDVSYTTQYLEVVINDIPCRVDMTQNVSVTHTTIPININDTIMELDEIKSITMPQRMPGYSVRLVNTDITPDEYPTMLYPKLIDTTLPITGKLDYTNYKGTSLAWAYAYTTDDVNINPLGSQQQGNITNDYNKLYGTDYVDIVDVWVYKDTDTSKLSTNEAITKAYIELTSANYTSRVDEVLQWYPNCTDVYLFEDGSVTSLRGMFENKTITFNTITFMNGYFDNLTIMWSSFRNSKGSLTTVNNIPNSVENYQQCFQGCTKLTTISNISSSAKNLSSTFQGCKALTQAPAIPNSVTDMSNTFTDCTSLTQAPAIGNGVTIMYGTFQGCTALTTASTIPSSVTNMTGTFDGCKALTTPPTIAQSVTNMQRCFKNCSSLTTAPNIPDGVTDMSSCFYNCSAITDWSNMLDFQFNKVTNLDKAFGGTQVSTSIFENKTITTPKVCIRYLFQYYKGDEFIAPQGFTFGATDGNEVEFHTVWSEGDAPVVDLSNLEFTENTIANFYNAFFGGYGKNNKLQRVTLPSCKIKGANMAFHFNTALTYLDMSRVDASLSTGTNELNLFNQHNTALTTFKPPKNISTNLDLSPCTALEEEWVHAVVDNLAEVESATLTLNETLGAYLTPDEVFSANAKGWTIVGASSDFTIVNASDDVSGYTTDENVTSCFIELTNDNYKTRIDEVLQWYPNCTDLYFFDDGSVTSLSNLFGALNSVENGTYKLQVEHITFIEGYFDKCITLYYAFRGLENLLTVTNLPDNVDDLELAFNGCTKLTTISNIPSKVRDMRYTFQNCKALNQQFDLLNIPIADGGLRQTFIGCSSLTTPPILPSNYTGSMQQCFSGCTSLTQAPTIPQGVTNMNSCFQGCSSLTTAPNIPDGVTDMSSCFYGCSKLTTAPTIPQGVTNMQSCFYKCTSLTQAPNIPSSVTNISMMLALCEKVTSITLPLANIQTYNGALNSTGITDITWVGERNSDFDITSLYFNGCSQQDIQELVPEHLADLTASGTTATLTLGEYASHLSIGEILSAQAKGWTIEGNFSMDYAIVNASTDLSAVEVNSDITMVIVELTNDNYKTRLNEVYTKYPSMTDIVFSEDGTVTTLADMFNNSNNNKCRSKIKKIEFLEGYFQNLTNLSYSFYQCSSLTDIVNIPSGVTNMYRTFYYCYDLENVPDLPDGVTNVNYTFYHCDSLITAPKLGKSTTVLDYTFYGCDYLETVPEFPPNLTKLTGTFSGCSKLTSVPDIPNSVTDMSNAFYNCSRLVVAPKLPTSVHTLSSTFYGCSSLKTPPSIIPKSVVNTSSCFNGCTSLVTPPEFEHVDGTGLYTGRMYQNCSKMTTAPKIPNGVDNILGMFVGCSALTIPPTIPDSVTNMQEVFNNCTGLTQNPNVPTGVTNLKYAFSNSSITAITIPLTNLTTYDYAISKCPNLTDVTWVGELTNTFNVKNLYYRSATDNTTPTATDIQELIPEHLGTVTGKTLTLGDYISYLTEDEIAQAVAKGWTIQ